MDTADYYACQDELDGAAWHREAQSYGPNDDDLTWWCEECGDVTEEPCGVCADCQKEGDR